MHAEVTGPGWRNCHQDMLKNVHWWCQFQPTLLQDPNILSFFWLINTGRWHFIAHWRLCVKSSCYRNHFCYEHSPTRMDMYGELVCKDFINVSSLVFPHFFICNFEVLGSIKMFDLQSVSECFVTILFIKQYQILIKPEVCFTLGY